VQSNRNAHRQEFGLSTFRINDYRFRKVRLYFIDMSILHLKMSKQDPSPSVDKVAMANALPGVVGAMWADLMLMGEPLDHLR
jgi:hypothetical protein